MNSNLKIVRLETSVESSDICFDDPCYSFFVFRTPALIDSDDSLLEAKSGSVFLKGPTQKVSIKGSSSNEFSYSILSFKGSDASKTVKLSNITINHLLTPLHIHYADSILSKLAVELEEKTHNWQSVCLGYLLQLLAKTLRLSNHSFSDILPDHAQNLRDLRTEIHENYSKQWKIDEMAEKMQLSTSRFASLYKQTFKISPTEDLIQTRIDQAKKMLSESKVSVKKVSEACGFESVHYFHRAFKKRSNITPKHFQNAKFVQGGSVLTNERVFSLDKLTQQAEYSGVIELIDHQLHFHGNTSHVSELLGHTPNDLKELPFLTFIAPQDLPLANDAVSKILQNKNVLDLSINLCINLEP